MTTIIPRFLLAMLTLGFSTAAILTFFPPDSYCVPPYASCGCTSPACCTRKCVCGPTDLTGYCSPTAVSV